MAHAPSLRWWRHPLALALLALPPTAAAQISPTTPAHPNLPWGIGVATPQGQLIRYIYVPPQPVTLQYLVPGAPESAPPAAEPAPPSAAPAPPSATADAKPPEDTAAGESVPATPKIVYQQVTVPGYYVRETTVGFHYPDRWTIEQVGPNTYRWRPLPAQFVPK
jgi:hypothetical protein